MIFLIKDIMDVREFGMSMSSVNFVYFSRDIFEEIKNTIHGGTYTRENLEQQKTRKSIQDDLGKIQ
jgi:hypothetical protein